MPQRNKTVKQCLEFAQKLCKKYNCKPNSFRCMHTLKLNYPCSYFECISIYIQNNLLLQIVRYSGDIFTLHSKY